MGPSFVGRASCSFSVVPRLSASGPVLGEEEAEIFGARGMQCMEVWSIHKA